MTGDTTNGSSLHALLIGIDCYLPGMLPGGVYYPSLRGCVRDVTHVEHYLRTRLEVPEQRVVKLTATNTGAPKPPEPREQWPTYENMVAAFRRVSEQARAGDYIYVHYSGHGGRTRTLLPERKGPNGIDEALVPVDIHSSEARYLRDIELARVFQRMVEQGLHLRVVLDCCHSGGAIRGIGDVAIRGLSVVDESPRPQESLVASPPELAATWLALTDGGTRNVALGSGWLPEPQGYTLLAACRPTEFAYEYAFNGTERNGALTYWLLDSLEKFGASLSAKVLHERIVAKVHAQFEQQTPQLQGEGQNALFGARDEVLRHTATVLEVDQAQDRVRLASAGQAFGNRKGAQFAIFPVGTTDFQDATRRQAIVTITEVGATDSWAGITASFASTPIEQGAPAVLLDQGSLKLVRKVGFPRRDDLAPVSAMDQAVALEAVQAAMADNPWVTIATADDTLEYQVVVNDAGEYEIWDPGGVPFANLRPAIKVGAPGAAAAVVRRLAHLARYHAARQLDNHDPLSPLARKLVVELLGVQDAYDPGDPPEPQPFDQPGNTPILRPGQWTFLRIRNDSTQSLNVALLDLQPDWGISQIYPSGAGDWFVQFEPGHEEVIPLRASLPAGYTEGVDVLKVFATAGAANFRRLELPPLDEPPKRSATQRATATRGEANPLEQLMDAIAGEAPPRLTTRTFTTAAYPSREWTTASVELRVRSE